MFIVEYQAGKDPLTGVPKLEETGRNWIECAPAVFDNEVDAKQYMEALAHHFASAMKYDVPMMLRYFRVVRLAESKAENVHLAARRGA